MHLHISRVRRGDKTYAYGQLVESYRRPDGMPTQRVVAKLGQLTEVEFENLRAALQASRHGQRVFVQDKDLGSSARFLKPTQNLRYLDVAVLYDLWRQRHLDDLLNELLPRQEAEVPPADVVAALVFQRCVDPGSKLYAERWFPRTALPELLGIEPTSFNNTRVHRVLDALDACTPRLMQRLPALYGAQDGKCAAFFLDVTDARFVGHGPGLAETAKTKEGLIERKIGIVLLCNQHGLPMRWQVIAGKKPDAGAMHDVIADVRGLSWLGEAPIVCDRAMGSSADIGKLLRSKVRFVTALRVNEYSAYTDAIPHACVADLQPASEPAPGESDPCALEAARRIEQAGLECITPTLYVRDLGVVERDAPRESSTATAPTTGHGAHALQQARHIRTMVEQGEADSYNSAVRRLGVSRHAAKWYRQLLKLDVGIQQRVLDDPAVGLSISQLTKVARLRDPLEQQQLFGRMLSGAPRPVHRRTTRAVESPERPEVERTVLRLHAALTFNPQRFVQERRHAAELLDEMQAQVRALNERLARPRCKRTRRDIEVELDRMLRRRSALELYRIHVSEQQGSERTYYEARLELDTEMWQRRRRYDGFSLIVAHPDLDLPGAALCKLYRAKDAVEKDFQVIKSVAKLRPIWHRTDAKVRAHVTLCMLALLLERTLGARLTKQTAEQAIETLRTCCLNRFEDGTGTSHYVVTHPDGEQRALLRELACEALTADDDIVARLRPR